jgi:DNA polymerase-3 subunit alpha
MTSTFVHLRVHTEFSLVDSVVRVSDLIDSVAAAGMPAVAVTDESNLFAMVKFYRAALAKGIKPIVGVDLRLREAGERAQPTRLTLLCQNSLGYGNLTRIVTRAYLEGHDRGTPLVDRAWLTPQTTAGLIALSGGLEGDVARALDHGRATEGERVLRSWADLFGDRFYLELQRLGRAGEEDYIAAAVELAAKLAVPVVATNDVRFIAPGDFDSHEARVCIQEGAQLGDATRPRRYARDQYLRPGGEMQQLFADLPEALANSVEIARRCSLTLKLGEARLPEYPVPEGVTVDEYLRREAARGLEGRLAQAKTLPPALASPTSASPAPDLEPPRYYERLATELDVIGKMGFPGYFLIVADFIRWARSNGVPVGPGRGSGAGSVVAWALGITDIDPLRYDLLFERFLNPERVSMPDFDVDFCMEGRDRVIEYVADKYGRDRVSQIITYGTMAAKAVVRDVGRVLGLSYGYVDRIAKLIPFELGITLEDALAKEPELKRLYHAEEEVRNLIDLARSLEGLTRNAGTHAGGVVIAPSKLTDFAPLYCEAGGSSVVTQFDKDDVEAAGLVKFDFLGLRTLTIIDRAVRNIDRRRAEAGEAPLDVSGLPMDDAATYQLLKSCRTTAVFQLESRGMKDLIRRLQPDSFEDIIALVALFRPGPLQSGMVEDFINRKHGRIDRPIDYLHPWLQGVLAPTYGVILYQEQVMQIAQVLAGYTLGGADLLRRAMGKKKPEEMATQRSIFVSGATRNGVEPRVAAHIFDLMEKFAGYGFNKSHSAAYALLSYQTAWLKAHYPAAFMAAVLSADMDFTDKVVTLIDECRSMGLTIRSPDVNESVHEFAVADERTLRYGLGAIKGIGQGAVEAIVAERDSAGPFSSLEDLCRRLDPSKVGRRVVEALIRSGSLDRIGPNRATLWSRLGGALQLGEQNSRAQHAGQVDFFGLAAAQPSAAEWPEAQRLAGERETLGLYLTGHPIARFESELPRFVSGRIVDISSDRPVGGSGYFGGKLATIAGLIHEIRKRGARTSVVLDDRTGRMEVTFFDEIFQQHRDLIVKDALVLIEGQLRFDEFSDAWRLAARKVIPLDRLREQQARRLVIRWPDPAAGSSDATFVDRLGAALGPYRPGSCEVSILYRGERAQGTLTLGPEWTVRPTPALIESLEALVGREDFKVLYGPPNGSSSSALG